MLKPSVRFLALVPVVIVTGAVVLDFVLIDFFGVALVAVLSLLVYVGVGLLLTLRLPRHPIGWLLLGMGTFLQLSVTASAYAWAAFVRAPGSLPLGEIAWFFQSGWILALGCLFLAVMLFPTGRPPSRRWHVPVGLVVAATALLLAGYSLAPREFKVPQAFGAQNAVPLTMPNPLAIDETFATLLGYAFTSPLTYAVFLLPVAAIVSRFRTAHGNERQQIKWFAYTSSIVALFVVGSGLVPAFFLTDFGAVVAVVAVDLIPISVAIAILRYRLYDIDVLINRTIVYGATSAAIAVTFFFGLVALQAALGRFTSGSEVAVAASTLLSFALFQPVRRRVQDAVNRRFDRSRYNAARTVDGFTDRLRDEVDLMELRADLLGEVQLTMAPAHVSLWLRERPR
ncbi:MAG TPA: hypothetical protein VIP07_00255 [Candidatus Limnocylindria bacterium]